MKKITIIALVAIILYPPHPSFVESQNVQLVEGDISDWKIAHKCLYENILYEARGEGKQGMIAVGNVTLNRTKSSKFPTNVCDVVYQPYQFSWTHQPKQKVSEKEIEKAKEIAFNLMNGDYKDNTGGSLYYHSASVTPEWSRKSKPKKVIGSHIFYVK